MWVETYFTGKMLSEGCYFLTRRTVQFIMLLGGRKFSNISFIARKTHMTYYHAHDITKRLLSLNIIKTEKRSRETRIELTEKGNEVYACLKKISDMVELHTKR